jgi:hypothetical protein
MPEAITIEAAILKALEERGPCTVDALVQALPDYSRTRVVAVVDRLKQDGRLLFCCPTEFEDLVSTRPTWHEPD